MPADIDLIILDGGTFCYTDENGDVEASAHEGFFFQDVRHLSRWQLRVDGRTIDPLTSRRVDYYSGRVVGTPKSEADGGSRRSPSGVTASSAPGCTRTSWSRI